MVFVTLEKISKYFDQITAAYMINLETRDGEFFTFLGPSGCGKTTTMRIIAGLEHPSTGKILYDGTDVTQLPSHKRNTGMVFQNYALWPHMKIWENIAYGLEVRKTPKEEIMKKVDDALNLVGLAGMGDRFPNQLSGGQQQRVALARVLVIEPNILLLDEPLSNLDAKLRVEMREEIKDIQRKLGITTIYVTHNQEEAMAISDRVAIQNHGKVIQVGSPNEIYDKPENLFIATFIGKGALIEGMVEERNTYIKVNIGETHLEGVNPGSEEVSDSQHGACVIRQENFLLKAPDEPHNILEGVVQWAAYVGPVTEVKMRVGEAYMVIDAHQTGIITQETYSEYTY